MTSTGLLGQGIDRILRGDLVGQVSRARRIVVAVGCAAAIVGVAASRRTTSVQPLREDPQVAQQLAAQKASEELYRSAQDMTREQVEQLVVALLVLALGICSAALPFVASRQRNRLPR